MKSCCLPTALWPLLSATIALGSIPLSIEIHPPPPAGFIGLEDEAMDVPFTVTPSNSQDRTIRVEAIAEPTFGIQARTEILLDGLHGLVRVQPGPNQYGTIRLTLRATDSVDSGPEESTSLTWKSVEDDPVLLPLPDLVLTEGEPAPYLPVTIADPETPEPARLTWKASRPGIVETIEFLGAGALRHAKLKLLPDAVGTVTVSIGVTELGPTHWSQFQLGVRPREFLPMATGIRPRRESFATWADLNGDGLMDLLPLGTNSGPQTVAMNTGNGTWPSYELPVGDFNHFLQQAYHAAWTDFDGDGRADAMLSWYERPVLALNRTEPLGTSPQLDTTMTNGIPRLRSSESAWGDLDGDGDSDLIITGITLPGSGSKPMLAVLRNDSGSTLIPVSTDLPNTRGPVVVADFDNDGRPDVLICNPSAKHPGQVWLNRGDFVFQASHLILPSTNVVAAGALDFNGDGQFDLWTLERIRSFEGGFIANDAKLVLYEQTRAGFVISQSWDQSEISDGFDPAWADFDADGDLDMVAPGLSEELIYNSNDGQFPPADQPVLSRTSVFVLYRNDGTGHFVRDSFVSGMRAVRPIINSLATPGQGVAAADVNRDGAVDLWVPPMGLGALSGVLTNASRVLNLLTSEPANPSAVLVGSEVHFRWSPASDWNQSAPLTYNLRIGSRPGANDILPSLSLPDGTRLIPAVGNCGLVTFRILQLGEVPPSTLYWAVQAVDNSFEGGPWSAEQEIPLKPERSAGIRILPHRADEILVDISGKPRTRVRIQQSADLIHWEDLDTALIADSGNVRVPIPVAPQTCGKFFLAVPGN
ncbi:MAG: VCBS repeat-containing protein [Verrucomicrobiota bacterium]